MTPMNSSEITPKTPSDGLWIPAVIICAGFILSLIFVFKTLKDYKQPRPLLIKPSSVEQPSEIADALYKALYPLKKRGFGVQIAHLDDNPISFKVATALIKNFPPNKFQFKFSAYQVLLSDEHDPNKTDCKNTALFNLKRKPERKWKNKIYFTVCTTKKETFSLFYTF